MNAADSQSQYQRKYFWFSHFAKTTKNVVIANYLLVPFCLGVHYANHFPGFFAVAIGAAEIRWPRIRGVSVLWQLFNCTIFVLFVQRIICKLGEHFWEFAQNFFLLNPFKTCQVIVHFWTMVVIKALFNSFCNWSRITCPWWDNFSESNKKKKNRTGLTLKIHLAFQLLCCGV